MSAELYDVEAMEDVRKPDMFSCEFDWQRCLYFATRLQTDLRLEL